MLPRFGIFVLLLLLTFSAHCQQVDFWDMDFARADSMAISLHGFELDHPDRLADSLVAGLHTDVEKFRSIFRWITDNINYDYAMYLKIERKEEKFARNKKRLSEFASRTSMKKFRRMIRQKKTICSGYAMLLEYMCNHVGLQCEFVSGYGKNSFGSTHRGPNHAWNAIWLNGKWYLCDVTWASGSVDTDREIFIRDFNSSYFLTDPSLFIGSHYPTDPKWTLMLKKPTLQEFIAAPSLYEGFIENKINQYFPTKELVYVKQNENIKFWFTSNADFTDPEVLLTIQNVNTKKNIRLR
jgi:transglutaminase/protease-like cytokinesis protein 3